MNDKVQKINLDGLHHPGVLIPSLFPLHEKCEKKWNWYRLWHLKPYVSKLHWVGLVLYILILSFVSFYSFFGYPLKSVKAAGLTCTSQATGNWSDAGTWIDCGGGVPGTGDSAIIAAGHTVTLTVDAVATTVTINATGVLDLGSSGYILTLEGTGAAATVLTVSGTLTPGTSTVKYTATNSGGNVNVTTTTYSSLQFTPAAAESYDMTGSLTGGNAMTGSLTIDANATLNTYVGTTSYDISCVNVTVNTSGVLYAGTNGSVGTSTFTVSGTWLRSGTFTYGQSTVNLTGTGNVNGSFYNLTAAAATKTTTATANLGISGVLTLGTGISSGNTWYLYASGTPLVTSGATINSGIMYYASAATNITSTTYGTLYISGTGTVTYTQLGNVTSGTLTLWFATNGGRGTWDTGGFTLNASSLVVGAAGALPLDTFKPTGSGAVTISGNVTINAGSGGNNIIDLSSYSGTMSVGGNWTNNDTFTAGTTATVAFTKSSGTQTLNSGGTGAGKLFNNLTHSGAGTLQLLTNALDVDGNFSQTAGIFDANSLSQNFAGNFSLSLGTTYTKGGTLTFDGTTTYTDSTASKQNVGTVVIGSSPDDVTLASDFAADSLTINAGDTLYTMGYEVDIGSGGISLTTGAPGGEIDTTDNGGAGYEGDGTIITDAGNFTINAGGVFTKCVQASRRSLVKMDGGATKTFTSDGEDMGDFQTSVASTDIDLQDNLTTDTVIIDANTTLDLGTSSYILTLGNAGATATVLTVSGTLTPGTSTVKYTATNSGGNVNVTTTTYSSLQFTPASAESYDMTGSLTAGNAMTGSLTIDANATLNTYIASTLTSYDISLVNVTINTSGVLYAGTNDTVGTSTFTVSGAFTRTGTFTRGRSTVELTGTATHSSGTSFYNLTAAAAGKITTVSGAVNVYNTFTLGTGTLTSPSGWGATLYGSGTPFVTGGATITNANISYRASSPTNITSTTYSGLLINGNTTFTAAGDITVTGGLSLAWTSIGGTTIFTNNGYAITAGSLQISTSDYNNYGWERINLTGSNNVDINGNVTIYGAKTGGNHLIDASGFSGNFYVGGNWDNNGSQNYTKGSETIIFDKSSGTQTLNTGGTGADKAFNNLTHSGAGTLQLLTNALDVDGNFTNSAGTFDANDLNINVAKNWTISGGSFSADVSPGATTQTVTFDGADSSTQIITGDTTFNNFTASTAANGAGRTLQFVGISVTTVGGTWTITGFSGKMITMQSSAASSWVINPTAATVTYANVSWSNDIGVAICATYSIDGGNNSGNWDFSSGASCDLYFAILTTDKADYPGHGETITLDARVNNDTVSDVNDSYIDYVIFIDSNSSHEPDAGETYVTANCAGSDSWASGNYTFQTTNVDVPATSFALDSKNCANTNFPSVTTYTLWAKWWDGVSVTYATKYVTFTSVPTLTEMLFLALIGGAVFLGIKRGAIRFRATRHIKFKDLARPTQPDRKPIAYEVHSKHNLPRQVIDGIQKRKEE